VSIECTVTVTLVTPGLVKTAIGIPRIAVLTSADATSLPKSL